MYRNIKSIQPSPTWKTVLDVNNTFHLVMYIPVCYFLYSNAVKLSFFWQLVKMILFKKAKTLASHHWIYSNSSLKGVCDDGWKFVMCHKFYRKLSYWACMLWQWKGKSSAVSNWGFENTKETQKNAELVLEDILSSDIFWITWT